MVIRCHRNLHRRDWSISAGGRVVDHVPEIILASVTFLVRQNARLRVIERRCREVHAWAIGEIVEDLPPGLSGLVVRYNPYVAATFVTGDDIPVTACDYVHFTAHGVALAYGEVH